MYNMIQNGINKSYSHQRRHEHLLPLLLLFSHLLRLLQVRVFNAFDDSQPRLLATSSSGQVLLDTSIPMGEKIHKVSDFFVYLKADGRTIGFNTLSFKDTSLLISQSTNTSAFNMFQHSFSASVSRIATFEGDSIQPCDEQPETSNVSLNPLSMVFNYKGSPVTIDLLECFACSSEAENCVDIAHANNIFRVIVSAHAHLFLIQALNVSSLLLARTTSHLVAISYLARQNEKIQQKLISLLETSESSDTASREDIRQMLLLKNVVVTQRLNSLQQIPLPGIELIQHDISPQIDQKLLKNCRLASLFLYHFNMNSFRIWRKPMEIRDMNTMNTSMAATSTSQQYHQIPIQIQNQNINTISSSYQSHPSQQQQQQHPVDHVTTHNGTTTFHSTIPLKPRLCEGSLAPGCSLAEASEQRKREMAEQKKELAGTSSAEDYFVRKTNGRLGLTIYAHNDDGVIRAEVRGVTSFAPRCAQVGDSVVAVDSELISSVRNASDVEKLLRIGKVIHLRRKTPLPPKAPAQLDATNVNKKTGCAKLAMALQELLVTEKKYVNDLREMNDVFLCMRQVRDIMHAAIRLYKMQTSFVDSIEEAIGDMSRQDISVAQIRDSVMRVCAVFINKCADFKIYAEYAAGYHLLQHEIKSKKELLSKLEAVNSTREQHCSWESRMIKPVQRIVQYPLLLKNIADALPKDARERIQVETALQKMQTSAEYVNEMQRLHEDYAQYMETVRKANENMLTEKGLRLDNRELLVFAHIKWRDAPAEHYVVFVFHSLILLLPSYARKEIKMKWTRVLPINEIDINEMPNDTLNLKLYHAAFEGPNGQLSHSNPNTVYNIECCQSQLKQHLIKNIKKARAIFSRESHRPLSGSSQSDGGYVSEVSKDHRNSK
ncbi:hypothetical protein GCK72_002298 [Caenorhabditis remanei]|uniref:DH domain-containing protein n=2 Tax=Caenorhabditis remanei TaxID=31234 RepID=A0A6A5HS02_CAERE|nr:hypothetical protein GCK72_002298 [Caenorhabditis remanei]KAF1770479.1 hypothetical protein GCK72_002298 [Caenorhabditis remanei]